MYRSSSSKSYSPRRKCTKGVEFKNEPDSLLKLPRRIDELCSTENSYARISPTRSTTAKRHLPSLNRNAKAPHEMKPTRIGSAHCLAFAAALNAPSEAAHSGSDGGMSMKASDYSCVPLCVACHRTGQHAYHTATANEEWRCASAAGSPTSRRSCARVGSCETR